MAKQEHTKQQRREAAKQDTPPPCTHCVFFQPAGQGHDRALVDILDSLFGKLLEGKEFAGALWMKGRKLHVESTRSSQGPVLMLFPADH